MWANSKNPDHPVCSSIRLLYVHYALSFGLRCWYAKLIKLGFLTTRAHHFSVIGRHMLNFIHGEWCGLLTPPPHTLYRVKGKLVLNSWCFVCQINVASALSNQPICPIYAFIVIFRMVKRKSSQLCFGRQRTTGMRFGILKHRQRTVRNAQSKLSRRILPLRKHAY